MSFADDDKFQRKVRDRFLLPYYEKIAYKGRFVPLDGVASRLQQTLQMDLHVDTLVCTRSGYKAIEEKFVRWPGYEYHSFALETRSCTNPGRQSDGWMVTSKADVLAYVFVREHDALVYFVPLPELQAWFEKNLTNYRVSRAAYRNRTECRIVPIRDVVAALPQVEVRVLPAAPASSKSATGRRHA